MAPMHDYDLQGYQPCPNWRCRGGWVNCRWCQGRGGKYVEARDYSSSYSGRPTQRWKQCFDCKGKGGDKCSECKGRGSIARERRLGADEPTAQDLGSENQLMDVAKSLAEKVKKQEERGYLPYVELGPELAPSPPESNYPPLTLGVGSAAAFMLYDYFDNRQPEDQDDFDRKIQPYIDRVTAAWEQGRNMLSIRLLGTLQWEFYNNMQFYWSDDGPEVNKRRYIRAAHLLGIEDDWPELLPSAWP
jgi:hypothetical protein